MNTLCRFGVHTWSSWSKVVEGYGKKTQFKCCLNCHAVESRGIYGEQVNATVINEVLEPVGAERQHMEEEERQRVIAELNEEEQRLADELEDELNGVSSDD